MIYLKIRYLNKHIMKLYQLDKPMQYPKLYLNMNYTVNFWLSNKLYKRTLPLNNRADD